MNGKSTTTLILEALAELNAQLPPGQKVPVSPDTLLFGQGGKLDSLSLVNFILLVEERLETEFGVSMTLADERAMSQRNSPFRSIQSLSEYVNQLLSEKQNG